MSVPRASALRGCLLDIDGTLIDSNDAHARSWVDAFAEHDLVFPFAKVRPLIGKGGDKLMRELADLDIEEGRGKEIAESRSKIFKKQYLPTLSAFPDADELVIRLRERGLTVVVATSAEEDELESLLEQTGLSDLLRERTSSDDAERSKPDPDIVRAALTRARLSSAEALMIGDTPYDIEAARRSGIGTIALRCGGWWNDDALSDAVAIYDDPATLVRSLEDSPFA